MLGERIANARIRLGLSRQDLAKLMDVSYSLVSKWERNERTPSTEDLPRLARVLKVSVEYLLSTDMVSQDLDTAWRRVDSVATQDTMAGFLRVWNAIQNRPEMQQFIL